MVGSLSAELKSLGRRSGLHAVGVTTADPFAAPAVQIQRRKAVGGSGRLRFTFGDPRSTDIRRSFPEARSLVVGARAYVPDAGPARDGGLTGEIARFAVSDAYVPLRTALGVVAGRLRRDGYEANVLVDDNRLVDRAAAVRAGLAWWGKSTMAIAPRFGPWFLFGSVVTDAVLAYDRPMSRDCGTCTACIPACPTGALDVPGVLDATRCIAYWLQTPGVIPFPLRHAIGNRVYGCDECLVSCPPGQRLASSASPVEAGDADLVFLLTAADEALLRRYSHFYIPRRNPAYLRRNALVALGNVGSPAEIPLIAPFLDHHLVELRAHAVAAVRRLQPDRRHSLLTEVAVYETHPAVMEELNRPGPGHAG